MGRCSWEAGQQMFGFLLSSPISGGSRRPGNVRPKASPRRQVQSRLHVSCDKAAEAAATHTEDVDATGAEPDLRCLSLIGKKSSSRQARTEIGQ